MHCVKDSLAPAALSVPQPRLPASVAAQLYQSTPVLASRSLSRHRAPSLIIAVLSTLQVLSPAQQDVAVRLRLLQRKEAMGARDCRGMRRARLAESSRGTGGAGPLRNAASMHKRQSNRLCMHPSIPLRSLEACGLSGSDSRQ